MKSCRNGRSIGFAAPQKCRCAGLIALSNVGVRSSRKPSTALTPSKRAPNVRGPYVATLDVHHAHDDELGKWLILRGLPSLAVLCRCCRPGPNHASRLQGSIDDEALTAHSASGSMLKFPNGGPVRCRGNSHGTAHVIKKLPRRTACWVRKRLSQEQRGGRRRRLTNADCQYQPPLQNNMTSETHDPRCSTSSTHRASLNQRRQ